MLCIAALSPAGAATLKATTSSFSSVWNNASGGDTILLAPGNYGNFNGGSKPSMVTIESDEGAGATPANVVFGTLSLGASQNIRFRNVTAGSTTVGTMQNPGLHIHFVGVKFNGPMCINNPTDVNQDTLVDSSSFINVGQSCTEGRLGVTGNNRNHSVSNGIVISNTVFSGSGAPGNCSDGIQINGGATGTVIGPGNIFTGIKQGSCKAHADPIQFYGASNTTITGNYFYGNSTGVMSPDCNGRKLTVTNNVFVTDGEYPDQIVQAGSSGDVYRHNTFANGAKIRLGNPNGCGLNSNVTITDNVLTGGLRLTEGQSSSAFTQNYNLVGSGGAVGGNSLSGSPVYVGGSKPTTFAGYALASSSLGYRAASDGTDMGIGMIPNSQPQPTKPNPPTFLSVVVK